MKTAKQVNESLGRLTGNPNVNEDTGIRFGIIDPRNLAEYVMDDIQTSGDDLTFASHIQECKDRLAAFLADGSPSESQISEYLCQEMGQRETVAERIAGELDETLADGIDDPITAAAAAVDNSFEWDYYESDGENEYAYSSDGVDVLLAYLGGAPILYIIKSPVIVHVRSLCSPCVPNGGDLDSGIIPEDQVSDSVGYQCYGLPADWYPSEED